MSPKIGSEGDMPDSFTHLPALRYPIQSSDESGLLYETLPCEEEIEITGNMALYLQEALSIPDGIFCVELKDASSDGMTTAVSTGYLRSAHRAVKAGSTDKS